MIDRTQKQIIEYWKTDRLKVSICCLTYNHEKYIKDTLDGFLKQKTKFPFEILIHDDASKDNTVKIIKEYEKGYPRLIKPIYQRENQKSKLGSGMNPKFNFPRAKGEFIALCDGDDYWTDPLKLQKQVTFLEENSEFHISSHSVDVHFEGVESHEITILKNPPIEKATFEQLLHKPFIPYSSMVFPKRHFDTIPEWFFKNKHGHAMMYLYCTRNGKNYHFMEKMGVYRKHARGMMMTKENDRNNTKEENQKIFFLENMKPCLNEENKRVVSQSLFFLYIKKIFSLIKDQGYFFLFKTVGSILIKKIKN